MKTSALGSGNLYEAETQPKEEQKEETNDTEATAEFGMTFTVPKVCLTLKTRKKALSKKIVSSSQSTEWELLTELEQIDFSMLQGD